jgi:hypothetical protein
MLYYNKHSSFSFNCVTRILKKYLKQFAQLFCLAISAAEKVQEVVEN